MNNIKEYREKELKNFVIGNILLVILLSETLELEMLKNDSTVITSLVNLFPFAIISAIVYIFTFLLDSLISSDTKQKIAYLGLGKLPGFSIFTDIRDKQNDKRLNNNMAINKYKNIYDNMPKDKGELGRYENYNWYKIYSECRNSPKVYFANRDFLLCRDISIMTLLLFAIYCALILIGLLPWICKILYFFIMEFVVSNIAMRIKATRLAYNVILEDLHGDDKKTNNDTTTYMIIVNKQV